MTTYTFKVKITVPDTSGRGGDYGYRPKQSHIREYIQDAVQTMGGSHHPDSPFFGLDDKDVKVSRLHRRARSVS